jgi:acyl-CoA thioesterase-2
VRPQQALPDDPRLHAAALAYLGDYNSDWSVARRLGRGWLRGRFASLDHAMWVHRAARWNDWWLVTTRSDVAHAGRAFTSREVYTREGSLVASIVQEALVL